MKLERASISTLNSGAPVWLADLRQRAFESFEKLDMPAESEEVWRYLDLDFDLDSFQGADGPGGEMKASDPIKEAMEGHPRAAHLVDGYVVEGSDAAIPLAQAIDRPGLQNAVESGAPIDLDLFSAAHHAFLSDLVFVDVPPGEADLHPRYIDVQATTPDRVSFPHVSIVAGENAAASVVVGYRSPDEAPYLVLPGVDVEVGAGARCHLSILQGFGTGTRSIAHVRARLARDSSLLIAEAGLGAKLSRLHLRIDLEGPGAEVRVIGLYFGEREQVLDYRAFINHIGRSTTSEMLLKGAVEDAARSVFTGLIRIEEDAARTHAFQTNRNLILSDGAQAQSVPNLEILCDDVMAGHASTSGPLEPEHLYYLRSRGLSQPRAERLLVRGFFDEVIQRFPEAGLAGPIRREVSRKFVEAQEGGRL